MDNALVGCNNNTTYNWNCWYCYACNAWHNNGNVCPKVLNPVPLTWTWTGGNVATTDIRPSQIVVEKDKEKITVTVKTADGVLLNTLILSADQAANLKKQL